MSVLSVSDLKTYITTQSGVVKAVDGVSFSINKGEVFGLIGESGSGKSMTALSIMRLLPVHGRLSGAVHFGGTDLAAADERTMRSLRGGRIAIVFQDPSSALDPVFSIGYQMEEAVQAHQPAVSHERRVEIIKEQFRKVRIGDPERVMASYPHQLSGGMKQRVMIAMALINKPELVILDEPTTALDVTIQAEILDLLQEIIRREHLSILFISHDFGVISRMCGRVAVMRAGRIVETGRTKDIIEHPREPYTQMLLESVRALT